MKPEQMDLFTVPDYRVLIVDDNAVNRKVAKSFLKDYQFELTEAAGGLEAAGLVRSIPFDLIFMDHLMPEMDGIETVRMIRNECGENGKGPVIIALTANAVEEAKEQFLNSGFQDMLAKPIEKQRLNHMLAKWIPDERKNLQKRSDYTVHNQKQEFAQLSIPGISRAAVKKFQSGTIAEYKELLELFCMDGSRKLALLQELLQKKEYASYEIEVHGLKSASANIGAMRLSKLAQDQEDAAVRADEEFIEAHSGELLYTYEKQLDSIQQFLENGQHETGICTEETKKIDKDTLSQELRGALEKLERFRSRECMEWIGKLLDYSLDSDIKVKLDEVYEQLKLYEDDEAERLLHNLLECI